MHIMHGVVGLMYVGRSPVLSREPWTCNLNPMEADPGQQRRRRRRLPTLRLEVRAHTAMNAKVVTDQPLTRARIVRSARSSRLTNLPPRRVAPTPELVR